MNSKALKELKRVKVQAKRNLEIAKEQRKAMQKMAKNFKECLDYKVCPRCGGKLTRTPMNWGFFDIFNPFVRRHWLYECRTTLCEFQYKKMPEVRTGPM